MANILICEPSLSDAASIPTVTSEQTEAPATNVLLMQPKELYESQTVASTLRLVFDLGTSASYDTFAVLFTNATANANWIVETSNTAVSGPWTSRLASTTMIAAGQTGYARPHAFYRHASTLTDRWVRISWTDGANPDGVFRIGRVYICKAYQPTVNAEYGLTFGFDDVTPAYLTTANERITRANDPVPFLNFTLTQNGASAWAEVQANLYELFRKRGSSRDVMVVIDPEDTSYVGRLIHYGTLQQRLGISLPTFGLYQASFELTGLI